MSKKLRFAAIVRVSTEKQERKGESLRTQKTEAEYAVAHFQGTIVACYGGQEHATPGFEKSEIDRLVNDARKGRFDAVVVANADRWSRDNVKSREGLDVFRQHKVRFFVGVSEYDLFNPEHVLFLGMSAVIGQFQAQHQNRKSILNRIERAKRGIPTCGKLPFGRTFDRRTSTWGIDKAKQATMQKVARRYLAGESMGVLAEELDINHSSLHKTLTKRCGTKWPMEFRCDDLNINETVEIDIPRLLPQKTIEAIHRQIEANKTYQHGQTKYFYLLKGLVFCAHCGYTMFGQTNHGERRYYRHAHTKRVRECPQPKGWVNATELEAVVIRHLFQCFGNPDAIKRAVEAATPNVKRIAELRQREEGIDADIKKLKASRARLIRALENDLFPENEVVSKLEELKRKEAGLLAEQDRLADGLEHLPSADVIEAMAKRVSKRFQRRPRLSNVKLGFQKQDAYTRFDQMTREDQQSLVQQVFNGTTLEGGRMGVYISWIPGQEKQRRQKQWKYTIKGNLIQEWGILPMPDKLMDAFFDFEGEDNGVVHSALC